MCSGPFDVVYTWVNGSDPQWQQQRVRALLRAGTVGDDTLSMRRFRDNDELRFSVRSLFRNAPWFRHLYLVTSGQVGRARPLVGVGKGDVTLTHTHPHRCPRGSTSTTHE